MVATMDGRRGYLCFGLLELLWVDCLEKMSDFHKVVSTVARSERKKGF